MRIVRVLTVALRSRVKSAQRLLRSLVCFRTLEAVPVLALMGGFSLPVS